MTAQDFRYNGGDARPGLIAQWIGLTPAEKVKVVAIIGGLILFLLYLRHDQRSRHMELLREQFHVPAGVDFAEFHNFGRSKGVPPIIEGVVSFSEVAFRDYAGKLDDPKVWSPIPLRYGSAEISGSYSANALAWQTRRPYLPGPRNVRWGHITQQRVYSIRNGRYFCMAIRNLPNASHAGDSSQPEFFYSAVACQDLVYEDKTAAILVGALDLDTRSLYMHVN